VRWHSSERCFGGGVPADLVLSFEHQQVGHVAEGEAQGDDLGLRDVAGELPDVDDPGQAPRASDVTFELLAVVAIGYA